MEHSLNFYGNELAEKFSAIINTSFNDMEGNLRKHTFWRKNNRKKHCGNDPCSCGGGAYEYLRSCLNKIA